MPETDSEGRPEQRPEQNPDARPRQQSGYFEQIVLAQLKRLPTEEQRVSYAKAMSMSVRLDTDEPNNPRPRSPYLIQRECGFSLKVQKDYKVALNKNSAIEFLNEFGLSVSKSSFNKRNSKNRYEEFYRRQAPILNKRNLVCTYAEWLHLESYPFEPELPQQLLDLIPDDWERPSKNDVRGNPPITVSEQQT